MLKLGYKLMTETTDPKALVRNARLAEDAGFDFVAIHFAAAELAVHRVQVHSMFARNERERFVEIHPQFVRRAGLARMVAGDGKAAANGSGAVLETGNVIALPAMKRDGDCREGLQGRLHVDFE